MLISLHGRGCWEGHGKEHVCFKLQPLMTMILISNTVLPSRS